MDSDDFLDPDSWPLILEALDPSSSSQNEEHSHSNFSNDQLSENPDSTILGRSPTPRIDAYVQSRANRALETAIRPPPTFSSHGLGRANASLNDEQSSQLLRRIRDEARERRKLEEAYLQSRGNRAPETSMSPPPTFSSHGLGRANASHHDEQSSQLLRRIRDEEMEKRKLEGAIGSTGIYNTQRQSNQNSPRFNINKVKLQHLQQLLPPAPEQLPKQNTRVLDDDICAHRLKQYISHMRDRTHGNDISYWKMFVSEYYAPGSIKKWCFSKYREHELRPAEETFSCGICGAKPGKGYEASSEVLARLFKMKFDSGMLDEILYIDLPKAYNIREGAELVLDYEKAVRTSVYNGFRVVHNGHLRVVFRHDLKILSWEFCIENHEEYMPQASFAPQAKQLNKAAEKCEHIQNRLHSQTSLQDLRQVRNMSVSAGIQIKKKMELPLLNDLGYPNRFFIGLRMCGVFNIMKDLMDFSVEKQMGAIDSLKNYPRRRNVRSQGTGPPVDDYPVTVNDARLVLECLRLGSRRRPGDEADQTRASSSNAAAARTGKFRRPGNR